MAIAEIHLIGEGKTPGWVQRWKTLKGKADMMLLSAHRVAAYASIQCVQKAAQEDYAQASFENIP